MQFLEKVEIQDRINQWTENQTFPLNSTKTAKQQFSEYRTYLAQLLVEVAGASAEERLIVAQHGAFNELVNILRWAREQDKDISRPLQEWICESVENIIDNNISSAEIAFQTEILIELQNLLENILPLEEVKFVHADALKLFTTYGRTDEQQKIMYDMGLTQTFLKTMKSKNSGVVEKSSAAIINMMIYDDNIMDKKELHKNFSECEQKGIISSLFQDGIINGKSDNAKQTSAYGLGWLFKTKELPNNMKSDVIKQLKSAMKNQTRVIQMNSSNALSILAWNQQSQKLTMKQEKYFQPLIHLLKCEDDEDVLVYITLFMALFIVNMKHSGQIGQKDEFLSVMEKIGGLQQLVKIFVNDDADQNQEIKKYVSIVIGQLHKAQKVPDQFRSALIDSLKQMAFDKDDEFVYLSGLVLARLSECNENIADIVAGDLDFIEQYISRTAYSTIEQGMLLALNLLNFGSEDVKNKVKAAVPRNIVRQLIRSQEEDELFQQDGLVLTAVLLNDILQFIS
ncbi:MAG: hypothetical protein EZS28_008087 [Streblomastix strix]|uniref:Uncharacterized protein n=1 Tax=Streblomastix strix TaxID=222440 RepID=A0A5J4WNA4_9EUKA|nr:MAG: hypothetical protein EZS28_008087 [Streblomastix strix]